jgi:hypothetical protein
MALYCCTHYSAVAVYQESVSTGTCLLRRCPATGLHVTLYKEKVTYRHTKVANTYRNDTSLHTADKNKNDNTTPMITRLNKTT